jgi:hypothetical protein
MTAVATLSTPLDLLNLMNRHATDSQTLTTH